MFSKLAPLPLLGLLLALLAAIVLWPRAHDFGADNLLEHHLGAYDRLAEMAEQSGAEVPDVWFATSPRVPEDARALMGELAIRELRRKPVLCVQPVEAGPYCLQREGQPLQLKNSCPQAESRLGGTWHAPC